MRWTIWWRCRSTVRRSFRLRRPGFRGIITPTWPRLRPASSNRPPSRPAADCHSTARSPTRARQAGAGVLRGGPPGEAALRETLRTQPEALPVIAQHFERGAGAIAEDKDRAAEGMSPSTRRHTAASPSIPLRKSTGSVASKIRLCGVSWSIRASPKRSGPTRRVEAAARGSECGGGCHRSVELDFCGGGKGPDGGGGHFHKARGWGCGCRTGARRLGGGARGNAGTTLFEVTPPQPQALRHVGYRQDGSESDRVLP